MTTPGVPRILLVEDDEVIREATRMALERYGFPVDTAADGLEGLERFRTRPPDLLLLDVMLPLLDGVGLCRRVREESQLPILMMSARTEPIDVVSGLEAGADDYIVKPFETAVLVARIGTVLRRTGVGGRPIAASQAGPVAPAGSHTLREIDGLELDTGAMEVRVAGRQVPLTPTELRLLLEFTAAPGVVLERQTLLERVWDYSWGADTRVVDVHVQRLRAKIGAERIETIRGFGYKLRRLRWNLRRQIAVTVAVVSFLVALTLGLLVHQASVRQHTEQARRSALAALDPLLTTYESTGAVADDRALPADLRRLAEQGHQGSMLGPGPNGTAMWAAAGSGGKVFSVRVEYREDERAVADLDRTIMLSAALAVAVTVLAGVFAADRISSRLRTAARTARGIAQGDLTARIGPLGGPRDEVAELAAAVDSMSGVLRSRLAGEQRFTADVAHELRTPLTGLLTAAELLPPGRPTELVQDRVRFLCGLTEDLLEVSRLDARAERADLAVVRLGPLVTAMIGAADPSVRLRIDADAPVTTDPRRLDRIVSNLLANALRHGAAPVEVRVAGATLTIRDHGPGYPDDVLRDGPQRFRTGARERGQGHGLGLTIAQGHAEAIGVELILRNDPSGGAAAELRLPAGEDRHEAGAAG